jgi:hypothetical protein
MKRFAYTCNSARNCVARAFGPAIRASQRRGNGRAAAGLRLGNGWAAAGLRLGNGGAAAGLVTAAAIMAQGTGYGGPPWG